MRADLDVGGGIWAVVVRLAYHPAFKTSLDTAASHYAGISPLLSEQFREEVISGVREIASAMVTHAVGPHGFRCYRCKRFPYLLYYEPTKEAIRLLAVIHAREHPTSLQKRL